MTTTTSSTDLTPGAKYSQHCIGDLAIISGEFHNYTAVLALQIFHPCAPRRLLLDKIALSTLARRQSARTRENDDVEEHVLDAERYADLHSTAEPEAGGASPNHSGSPRSHDSPQDATSNMSPGGDGDGQAGAYTAVGFSYADTPAEAAAPSTSYTAQELQASMPPPAARPAKTASDTAFVPRFLVPEHLRGCLPQTDRHFQVRNCSVQTCPGDPSHSLTRHQAGCIVCGPCQL